ncbi:MAG: hypothetical protein M1827_002730 [Pycnora praestabilis]|nr:MAG: hypothetical protein M1827_002730 [Pycnora praestabilis]
MNAKPPKILDIGLTVLHEPMNPIADILLVHGLQGHPRNTWTCKVTSDSIERNTVGTTSSSSRRIRHLFSRKQKSESSESFKTEVTEIFWPLDLLPDDCTDARILTWGYDSNMSHFFSGPTNQSNVFAIARDLLYTLEKNRLHCVLCRAAVERDSSLLDIYTSTKAVLFLGTPHRGSSKADSGEMLRKISSASGFNTSDRNIRALQFDSSELEGIHERFMKLKEHDQWHLEVRTFQEAKGMTGLGYFRLGEKVVNDFSSSLDGAERRQTINANHMTMCRYSSKDDDGYQKVVGELQVFLSGVQKRLEADELEKHRHIAALRMESPSQATTVSSTYSLNDIERLCMTLFSAFDITEYKSILPMRVEGTCSWILTNPQYLHWISEIQSCLLWISGHPGSGKTILAAYLLEYLNTNESSQNVHPIVCFFFCDEKIETQRDAKAVLRSIIFQILTQRRKLIRHVRSAYDIQGSHLTENFNELWRIFTAIASDKRAGPINIIVDAIDECEESTRNRFLESIATLIGRTQSITRSSTPCIKFLITSRPVLGRQYTTTHLQIEDVHRNIEEDLRLVIQTKIEGIVRRMNCRPETRTYLEQTLYSKADHTFLWVTLVFRVLEKSHLGSQKDFQRIVDDLPQGLAAIYDRFLHSISLECQEVATRLLYIIVGSLRPLTLDEIRILLALQDHYRTAAAVAEHSQPNIRETIEGILGPLVRISDSRVHLIHQSVKEYLYSLSTRLEHPLSAVYGVDPHRASMLLTKTCISYLQLDELTIDLFSAYQISAEDSPVSPVVQTSEADSVDLLSDPFALAEDAILKDPATIESEACRSIPERFILFDYSAMHWAEHFASCSAICPDIILESALALSESSGHRRSSWFRYYWFYAGMGLAVPLYFNSFVTACFFGHLTSVSSLMENQIAPDQDTIACGMYWASRMGHRDIADYLFQGKVLHDSKIMDGQTPLVAATQFGHLPVVELLIANDATDVNYRSRGGRTPISIAAGSGHLGIVQRLLNHKQIQPDIPDSSQWTPLFWAIGGKYLDILRMLAADKRVDLNHVDKQGRNALSWAAAAGEDEFVKFLLTARNLEVQHKDVKGRTALSWAAENGHSETISILRRSKRIDFSGRDGGGRNAISWACAGGHHMVLDYLIKYDSGGVDEEDENGWTPLAWALDKAAPKTVEVLLASRVVNVNRKDRSGRTPLSWAAGYGYVDIVRMLMNVEGVEIDTTDAGGRTPLSWATMYGFTEVMRCLQGFKE